MLLGIFIPVLQISRKQPSYPKPHPSGGMVRQTHSSVTPHLCLKKAPQKTNPFAPSLPRQACQESSTGMNVLLQLSARLPQHTAITIMWIKIHIIKIQFHGICMLSDTYIANTKKWNLIWLFTDCIQLKSLRQNVFTCYLIKEQALTFLSLFKCSVSF